MDYLKIFYGFEKTDARGQKNKNLVFEISHNVYVYGAWRELLQNLIKSRNDE